MDVCYLFCVKRDRWCCWNGVYSCNLLFDDEGNGVMLVYKVGIVNYSDVFVLL